MTDSLRAAAQAVVDAADAQNYFGGRTVKEIEAFRTALAEPQECVWARIGNQMYELGCKHGYFRIRVNHSDKHCPNCGKKIKFVESNDE